MLRDPENILKSGKRYIQRDGLRAFRLRIGVAPKGFFPPCRLIFSARFFGSFLNTFFDTLLFLDLLSPMFDIEESTMVEHDLCVPVPLEVYAERSMPNDSGNALILSKLYSRDTLLALFTQFSGRVNIQTAH